MTPFDAYQMFQALKAHFNSSYDYFKYNGKIKGAAKTFDALKNKYHYEKLARIADLRNYLVANFMDRPIKWVKDVLDERSEKVYNEFLRRKQSLTYIFKNEIAVLDDDNFTSNFRDTEGTPLILREFGKSISLNTFIALDKLVGFSTYYDDGDRLYAEWPEIKKQVEKYSPFFHISHEEREKMRKIVLDKYSHKTMNNVDKKNKKDT